MGSASLPPPDLSDQLGALSGVVWTFLSSAIWGQQPMLPMILRQTYLWRKPSDVVHYGKGVRDFGPFMYTTLRNALDVSPTGTGVYCTKWVLYFGILSK